MTKQDGHAGMHTTTPLHAPFIESKLPDESAQMQGLRRGSQEFAITGREVATLHQGVIASDDFVIRQDVSSFQRGIYFVRFQEGARVSTRKVLVQ